MRVFFLSLILLIYVCNSALFSDNVPDRFNYQGRLTDSSGESVADGAYNMRFYIYADSTAVTELWSSSTLSVTVENGLFEVTLSNIDDIIFQYGFDVYLGIQVGLGPVMMPLTKFSTVPYAFHSRTAHEGAGWTQDVDNNRIYTKGVDKKVGINNANPQEVLAVGEDLGNLQGSFLTVGNSNDLSGIALGENTSNLAYINWNHLSNGLVFGQYSAGTHYYGFALKEGNVKIGSLASTPSEDLVVGDDLGAIGGENIVVGNNSGSAGIVLGKDSDNYIKVYSWDMDDVYRIVTKLDGDTYNPMRIYKSRVAIGGDIYPNEALVVGKDIGAFYGDRVVVGGSTAGTQIGYMIGEDTDHRCWMLWDVDDNYYSMGYKNDVFQYNNLLTMKNGSIGIKASNPTSDLHVAGDICYTGSIGTCSDLRYKRDVSTLSDAMKRVGQLRGVSFSWRQEDYPEQRFSDKRQVGFIAQELVDVLPEAVSEDDNGYLNVDYSKLTPLLVEAIKEQQKQIDRQQNLIEELSERLGQLESNQLSKR